MLYDETQKLTAETKIKLSLGLPVAYIVCGSLPCDLILWETKKLKRRLEICVKIFLYLF